MPPYSSETSKEYTVLGSGSADSHWKAFSSKLNYSEIKILLSEEAITSIVLCHRVV